MRKIPALLTVLGLAALSLAGCASVGTASCERPAPADAAVQSQVTVRGEEGSAPTVDIETPMHVAKQQTWETATGDGVVVTGSPSQLVRLDISLYSGADGTQVAGTGYQGDQAQPVPLSQWIQTFPDFADALACASEGSRVVVALPPKGVAEQAAASLGIPADTSLVAVVDVQKAFLTRATGSAVFNDAHGLPTVVRAADGRPGIIIPDGQAPTGVVAQTLIKGTGDVVADDATVRVNYTAVSWNDRTVNSTTWDTNPEAVTLSQSQIPDISKALAGQTVGSQVLLVVPASDEASGSGSATASAVVYVFDILGIDTAAPAAG